MLFQVDLNGHPAALLIGHVLDSGHGLIVPHTTVKNMYFTAVLVMRPKVPVPRLPPGSFAQGQTGAAGAEHFSQKCGKGLALAAASMAMVSAKALAAISSVRKVG